MSTTSIGTGRDARRSREQWRQVLAEQADSGLSQSAFCAERDIAYSTFTLWKRKLGKRFTSHDSASGETFIELAPAGTAADERWEVELELGNGVTLRIRGH